MTNIGVLFSVFFFGMLNKLENVVATSIFILGQWMDVLKFEANRVTHYTLLVVFVCDKR